MSLYKFSRRAISAGITGFISSYTLLPNAHAQEQAIAVRLFEDVYPYYGGNVYVSIDKGAPPLQNYFTVYVCVPDAVSFRDLRFNPHISSFITRSLDRRGFEVGEDPFHLLARSASMGCTYYFNRAYKKSVYPVAVESQPSQQAEPENIIQQPEDFFAPNVRVRRFLRELFRNQSPEPDMLPQEDVAIG